MNRIIKHLWAFLLAVTVLFTSVMPVNAAENSDENTFPFNVIISLPGREEHVGEFFKAGDELYISGDTLRIMVELDSVGNGFERVDGATYLPQEEDILFYDSKTYYPFEEAMTKLCINTKFYAKEETLNKTYPVVAVVPANNIWSIVTIGNRCLDNPEYNLYGWTGEMVESNSNNSVLMALTLPISKGLFKETKSFTEMKKERENYNHYRTALWNIMLPTAELEWSVDYYNDYYSFLNISEYITSTVEDMNKNVPGEDSFMGESFKRITAPLDIMSLDDFQDHIEFYYNIGNMDENISNAVIQISRLAVDESEPLENAIKDTAELYQKNESPFDMYLTHVRDAGMSFLTDSVIDFFDFPASIKALIGFGKITEKETYDKSIERTYELAFGNLGIQGAAGSTYRLQLSGLRKMADHKKAAVQAKNLRDVMLVYLLAGHNAWEAVSEMDEYSKDAARVKREIVAEIDRLRHLSYVDYEVYITAEETKEELLKIASPDAEVEATPTPTPTPTPDVKPSAGENQFVFSTEYADYRITYDPQLFEFIDDSYAFRIRFADEIAAKMGKSKVQTSISVNSQFFDFDNYYNQMLTIYSGDEINGVGHSEPTEVALGGGFTAKYFDIDYTMGKDTSGEVHTNRLFYIDLNNGEAFHAQDVNFEAYEEGAGITYEEYLTKAFSNIEVFPKADAPKVFEDGIIEIEGDKATYRITYDPSMLYLYCKKYVDLYITYRDGVPGVLEENLRTQLTFTSFYENADGFLQKEVEYYNGYKFAKDLSFGEVGEIIVSGYSLMYIPCTYYATNSEEQYTNAWSFYLDLGTGEALCGQERITGRFADQIGLTSGQLLEKAFLKIEVISD